MLHRARFMETDELPLLQGLSRRRWQLPPAVSEKHMRVCIGNAISGNVINLLLAAVVQALGL